MTTDEAREVLENHKAWVLKFNHGMATPESKALEVAIASLQPAPVYHYLPEVPEDGEWVLGFISCYEIAIEMRIENGRWVDEHGTIYIPYAWTRIPPKPPVKEGGSYGKAKQFT